MSFVQRAEGEVNPNDHNLKSVVFCYSVVHTYPVINNLSEAQGYPVCTLQTLLCWLRWTQGLSSETCSAQVAVAAAWGQDACHVGQ